MRLPPRNSRTGAALVASALLLTLFFISSSSSIPLTSKNIAYFSYLQESDSRTVSTSPEAFGISTPGGAGSKSNSKSLLDRVCVKHKQIMEGVAKDMGFPKKVLKRLSCERLKRGVATWFNTTIQNFNQLYRITKYVELLEQQKAGKIAVVGGSVEMGVSDYFNVGGKLKAWPAKLEAMMRKVWPGVTVTNLAHGGYDAEQHLRVFDRYTSKDFHLYLLEFAINDQVDLEMVPAQKGLVHKTSAKFYKLILSQPSRPAVMNVECFRSALNNKEDANEHCPGHVRKLPNDVFFCDQWWHPQTWRNAARNKYGVPAVSYRDAVFPDLANPPEDLNSTWSGKSHPGPRVHFWIAETVFYAMQVLRENLAQYSKQVKKDDTICVQKKTTYDANEGKLKFPAVKSGCGWNFREDVKGKPGWIVETKAGAAVVKGCDFGNKRNVKISFKMQTGKSGLITGSYLVSYDKRMGRAKVWINDNIKEATVLDSRIESKVSIPRGFTLKVPAALRNQAVTVTFMLMLSPNEPSSPSKFKVLTLDSC